MIITISGAPGSGKSTVAKKLAKKLNWPKFYGGGIRRTKAKAMGLTLAEFNKLGEHDFRTTDFEVDEYLKKMAKKFPNCVIESRTAWSLMPQSIKIYIDVEEQVGAQRVFKELQKSNHRNEDKNLKAEKDVLLSHRRRKSDDIKRYRKYYKIKNVFAKKNYDFVLDTSKLTKQQVFQKVYQYIKKRLVL